jgi:hypothetical protein
MKMNQRTASLVVLSLLSALALTVPAATTVLATAVPNACTLVLTPSNQSPANVPAGSTTSYTLLLTYSDSGYPASFTLSASSSNLAWTVVSVTPSPVPSSGTSGSISQTITVTVTAPGTSGSTTLIRVAATNNQDTSLSVGCRGYVSLTSVAFQPPPGVPQFPLGIALLMALAIPALLVLKSKRSPLLKQ